MKTLNRTTEEFVRRHRLLIERTKNDPARLLEAVDDFPDLVACICRLHKIYQAVEQHRYFSKRPFIVQAHPEFRGAVEDFRFRWATAYDAFCNKRYEEAALRVSEEYMRCYRILVEQTGNDLSAVHSLAEQQPDLDPALRKLWEIDDGLYNNVRNKRYDIAKIQELRRFSGTPELEAARADVDSRCKQPVLVFVEEEDVLDEVEGNSRAESPKKEPAPSAWLEELLDALPDPPPRAIESDATDGPRSFDPARDSAADAIMYAEDFFARAQWDQWEREGLEEWDHEQYPIKYWAGEAFDWIHEAKGLNLREIERRMKEKEFPDFIVPQHVSDHYGVEAPHGLFAYLSQVRLAYLIGADLAAVALCRSVTELLIRYHYAADIPHATNSIKTRLRWLIEQLQDRDDFKFLRSFNLVAKVNEANDILHQAATDIEHRDRARGLLTKWVRVLEEMIDKAPAPTAR